MSWAFSSQHRGCQAAESKSQKNKKRYGYAVLGAIVGLSWGYRGGASRGQTLCHHFVVFDFFELPRVPGSAKITPFPKSSILIPRRPPAPPDSNVGLRPGGRMMQKKRPSMFGRPAAPIAVNIEIGGCGGSSRFQVSSRRALFSHYPE